MRISRANVDDWAKQRGLEPVQVDGIPEGFSFKEPNLTIGTAEHEGSYVAYVPLSEWEAIRGNTILELQTNYKNHGK